MSLLTWVFFGFIAGFIASRVFHGTRQGVVLDLAFAVVGAVIGGSLFTTIGMDRMFVAVLSAAILLAAYHVVSRDAR